MSTVLTIHGMLGQALVVIYLLIALGSYVRRQQGGLPMWVLGIAHTLLVLQVILGVILYIRAPQSISWVHPLSGIVALLALGLTTPLRRRMGRGEANALSALAVVLFAAIAVGIAEMR